MKLIENPVLRQPKIAGITPVWDENCKILILGSITSVDGMKKGFYYASAKNQLWQLVDIALGIDNKNSFVYLKNVLKKNYDNFAANLIDFKQFEQTQTTIKKKFAHQLLKNHIAICDVFEECYFNKNSSLDQDIILNNANYPYKTNKNVISYILENSNISTILVNSKFVEEQFYKMKILGNFDVKYVQSPSPRKGSIEKKIDCWKQSVQQGLSR